MSQQDMPGEGAMTIKGCASIMISHSTQHFSVTVCSGSHKSTCGMTPCVARSEFQIGLVGGIVSPVMAQSKVKWN